MEFGIVLIVFSQINTQFQGQWIIASVVAIASSFAVQKYINIDNQKKIVDLGIKTDNLVLRITEMEKNQALSNNNYTHLLESNNELKKQNQQILEALSSIKMTCAGKGGPC